MSTNIHFILLYCYQIVLHVRELLLLWSEKNIAGFLFYKLDHLNSVKTLNSFNPLDFKNVNRNTGLFLDYIDQSNTD